MITVLSNNNATEFNTQPGDTLWLTPEEVSRATGWELKPEGFCKDDTCVPIPAGSRDDLVAGGRVNLSGLWALMGKPLQASNDGDVWSLGEAAADRNQTLLSLQAPEFSLPDFSGKVHSITDYRRKRILLITWASW